MPDSLFANRLSKLLVEARKPDGRRYTRSEVAAGVDVTPTYISRLKSGKANPTYELVQRFSSFFQVPPAYFFEEKKGAVTEVEPGKKSAPTDEIALRAAELDERGREAVLEMIKHVVRISRGKGDPKPD